VSTVKIGKNYTIVIPEEFRQKLQLQPETTMVVSLSSNGLLFRPRHAEVKKHLGIFAKPATQQGAKS
jgi:bifunctional DNA-binding transcriptional regulator/antitoxin component of YhaV-PrlF toxin-antitoxin module